MDVQQAQKPYMQVLEKIHNVTFIPTIDHFCPTEKCIILNEEGIPLYYDIDHLNNTGSLFLAKYLEPYLTGNGEN